MEALVALESVLERGGPWIYILAIVITVIPGFIAAMNIRRARRITTPEPTFFVEPEPSCAFSEELAYEIAHRAATDAIKANRDHDELHLGKLFLGIEKRILDLNRAIVDKRD